MLQPQVGRPEVRVAAVGAATRSALQVLPVSFVFAHSTATGIFFEGLLPYAMSTL
jgi:hypothetical protein